MNDTLIYVGDELLDLFPGTAIAITFQALSVGQITDRNASYTNNIVAPPTENNITIIDNADSIESSTTMPYKRIACKVVQGGIEIPELNVMVISEITDRIKFSIYTGEVGILDPLDQLSSELDFGISEIMDSTFIQDYADGSQPIVTAAIDFGRYSTPVEFQPFEFHPTVTPGLWTNTKVNNKLPCRAATTGNITLSGLQTIDTVILVEGDRVMVRAQTNANENGIRIASTGAWVRAEDMLRPEDFTDAICFVLGNATSSFLNETFIQRNIVGAVDAVPVSFLRFTQNNGSVIGFSGSQSGRAWSAGTLNEWWFSQYYEVEYEFLPITNFDSTNNFRVRIDWDIASPVGASPDVVLRAYLIDEEGSKLLVLNENETADGNYLSDSGFTISLTKPYVKLALFAFIQNTPVILPTPDEWNIEINSIFIDNNWRQKVDSNFYLPQAKYHYTIQKILERLGTYSMEYPDGLSDFYERLLITYSRGYYGYSDASIEIDDTDLINMSKFVLPDIPQSDLLKDWLVRTFSLFRVINNTIEIKPVYNIIRDKEINAIDWTAKRDTSIRDKIRFIDNNYAQNNYFQDGDTRSDFFDRHFKGLTPITPSENKFAFTVSNNGLKKDKTIYSSIFSATQHVQRPSSTIETPRIPIYDIESIDRKDFKKDPSLRILFGKENDTGSGTWYDSTNITDAVLPYYKDDDDHNIPHFATWDHFIELGYSNFVEAIQKMKIVERWYFLETTDIVSLDLFKPIYDSGAYYLIDKIHNFVAGKTVKVELLKIS